MPSEIRTTRFVFCQSKLHVYCTYGRCTITDGWHIVKLASLTPCRVYRPFSNVANVSRSGILLNFCSNFKTKVETSRRPPPDNFSHIANHDKHYCFHFLFHYLFLMFLFFLARRGCEASLNGRAKIHLGRTKRRGGPKVNNKGLTWPFLVVDRDSF